MSKQNVKSPITLEEIYEVRMGLMGISATQMKAVMKWGSIMHKFGVAAGKKEALKDFLNCQRN